MGNLENGAHGCEPESPVETKEYCIHYNALFGFKGIEGQLPAFQELV